MNVRLDRGVGIAFAMPEANSRLYGVWRKHDVHGAWERQPLTRVNTLPPLLHCGIASDVRQGIALRALPGMD